MTMTDKHELKTALDDALEAITHLADAVSNTEVDKSDINSALWMYVPLIVKQLKRLPTSQRVQE